MITTTSTSPQSTENSDKQPANIKRKNQLPQGNDENLIPNTPEKVASNKKKKITKKENLQNNPLMEIEGTTDYEHLSSDSDSNSEQNNIIEPKVSTPVRLKYELSQQISPVLRKYDREKAELLKRNGIQIDKMIEELEIQQESYITDIIKYNIEKIIISNIPHAYLTQASTSDSIQAVITSKVNKINNIIDHLPIDTLRLIKEYLGDSIFYKLSDLFHNKIYNSITINGTGYLISDVAKDGNCFFTAIGDQLHITQSEVREIALNYITQDDHMSEIITTYGENFYNQALDILNTDRAWMDNDMMISYVADALNIRIGVIDALIRDQNGQLQTLIMGNNQNADVYYTYRTHNHYMIAAEQGNDHNPQQNNLLVNDTPNDEYSYDDINQNNSSFTSQTRVMPPFMAIEYHTQEVNIRLFDSPLPDDEWTLF